MPNVIHFLKFLRDLNIPNLDVRQHDLLKDDLDEGKYDLVHCRALLMHLAQPENALEKMARAQSRAAGSY